MTACASQHIRAAWADKAIDQLQGQKGLDTAIKPKVLSSGRLRRVELFPNRSGGIANRFDCARQLIFGHAKMPRPIFHMVLTLNNDFASVRSDFCADHLFAGPVFSKETGSLKVGSRLTGRAVQSTIQGWRAYSCCLDEFASSLPSDSL
jgi:hypothetical protein